MARHPGDGTPNRGEPNPGRACGWTWQQLRYDREGATSCRGHGNRSIKRLPPGDIPPETVRCLARYGVFRSSVRIDPTATADKISGGLLAEGVAVPAADARSPLLLSQAGATSIWAYVGLARVRVMGNAWSGRRLQERRSPSTRCEERQGSAAGSARSAALIATGMGRTSAGAGPGCWPAQLTS